MRKNLINMLGFRCGVRTVVAYSGNKRWLTQCDCGAEQVMAGADIRRGRTTTCQHKNQNAEIIRFFLKVLKTDKCWIWIAAKNKDGYGSFRSKQKHITAHRYSYILHKGKIENKLEIDHLCRNRSCVNPEHLEAVSHKENVHRGNMPSIVKSRGFLIKD